MAEFAVNNKVHIATKVLPFIANYSRELRMEQISEEKKSRKSNRIYRKNEKSTRRNRSSIKEGIGGYEETSR